MVCDAGRHPLDVKFLRTDEEFSEELRATVHEILDVAHARCCRC